jgi:D-alanine transaminase
MSTAYFNGEFLPKEEVKISPDDRGFLFADGIYEVVRWYEGFFYDMPGHMARLKRSMKEIRLQWTESDSFPAVASELITRNNLQNIPSLVYLQVTRGSAKRSHAFPVPEVHPTVYAFARGFHPEKEVIEAGINVILRQETRWSRCDIKSVSLLPNILSFQEARDLDCHECIFIRDGMITECAHSNVFFVIRGVIYTHPESDNILSGITRKNIIRIAREIGIRVIEKPVAGKKLNEISEAFITNTSFEIAPVLSINKSITGDGHPGPLTRAIRKKFDEEIRLLRG